MIPATAAAAAVSSTTAATPAIVRTADRRPSPAFARNLAVMSELAKDPSRQARRALDAIARSNSGRFAEPPSVRNSQPNWLKIALNSQR